MLGWLNISIPFKNAPIKGILATNAEASKLHTQLFTDGTHATGECGYNNSLIALEISRAGPMRVRGTRIGM